MSAMHRLPASAVPLHKLCATQIAALSQLWGQEQIFKGKKDLTMTDNDAVCDNISMTAEQMQECLQDHCGAPVAVRNARNATVKSPCCREPVTTMRTKGIKSHRVLMTTM